MPLPNYDQLPRFIAKIEFNFSYRKRIQHTKEELEAKEELRQLERLKEKKHVGTILDSLKAVLHESQWSLVYK